MKTDGEIKEAMDVFISREPKSMIWCESLTQRTNMSRVSLLRDKEAIMREKAIIDEQSRLNGARKEGIEKEKENSRLRDADRVLKLLAKKFGTLNDDFKEKIKNMANDNLNLIIENILDIESLKEVDKYSKL